LREPHPGGERWCRERPPDQRRADW
jgi:hypothetical protein